MAKRSGVCNVGYSRGRMLVNLASGKITNEKSLTNRNNGNLSLARASHKTTSNLPTSSLLSKLPVAEGYKSKVADWLSVKRKLNFNETVTSTPVPKKSRTRKQSERSVPDHNNQIKITHVKVNNQAESNPFLEQNITPVGEESSENAGSKAVLIDVVDESTRTRLSPDVDEQVNNEHIGGKDSSLWEDIPIVFSDELMLAENTAFEPPCATSNSAANSDSENVIPASPENALRESQSSASSLMSLNPPNAGSSQDNVRNSAHTGIHTLAPASPTTPVNNGRQNEETPDHHGSRSRSRTDSADHNITRKRTRDPSKWIATIRKKAKNSGQEYTSAKKVPMAAKKMREPCACKFNCVLRLSEEKRKRIFDTFWALGDHDRQWEFIRKNSQSKSTKAEDQPKRRKVCRKYFFNDGTGVIKVCKFMFISTLGICDSWIESAYSHIKPDKGNTSTPDKRGRHSHHRVAVTQEKQQSVMEHVATFPRVPSHYCRERSKREYLSRGLSLKKMARLYIKWADERNLLKSERATMRQYVDIVNANFNIGFFKPKKDQCNLCSIMRNKNNTRQVREEYKNKFVEHRRNKELSCALKRSDVKAGINDKSIAVCSFDLQKQLDCPKSEDACMFYKNKLTVFNFTVFNMIKRIGTCYLWHHGLCKKGSDEIASCLWKYIKYLADLGYKEVRFWSDNCAGQNKNRFLFSMYILAAVFYKIKIIHRYLEPGHTMMEVDSIHARIEKSTKLSEVWDFEDWVQAIEAAKQELPPYEVNKMNRHNVHTFKPLVEKQNWERSLKGESIKWRKVREVSVDGNEGNFLRVRYDFAGDFVTLSPNSVGRPVNLKTYKPPLAYNTLIPLSTKTIEHIQWFLDNNHIPVTKQQFFRDVLAGVEPVEEEATTDVEYDSDEELCTVYDAIDVNDDPAHNVVGDGDFI